MRLGKAVRERSQGLAWVFGLKPQCWVQARGAVILANYSQGLHQDSHWHGSQSLSSTFQTAVSLIGFLIFTHSLSLCAAHSWIYFHINYIVWDQKALLFFLRKHPPKKAIVRFLAARHSFVNLISLHHDKSRFWKDEGDSGRCSSGWGRVKERDKKRTHKRIECFAKWWLQIIWSVCGLWAEKLLVMWECETARQWLKYCEWLKQQVALIYRPIRCTSSWTDWAIHDWEPLKHCTPRFSLSAPFDSRQWVLLFPTPLLGVQFRKAQQVYQNLCCPPPLVALSFQKRDLVPDLILAGGASPGPVLPQHLVDFSCFLRSVINIVKELPVLRSGSLGFTTNNEMYCLHVRSFKSPRMFRKIRIFLSGRVLIWVLRLAQGTHKGHKLV